MTTIPGYEAEAARIGKVTVSTLQRWRREGYGPIPKRLYPRGPVLYPEEGFRDAVLDALKPGARPPQPVVRKVDPRKREAGYHMQPKGPDAAGAKRLMKSIRNIADRTERHGQYDHYYLTNVNVDGEVCFVFDGETLIDVIEPEMKG